MLVLASLTGPLVDFATRLIRNLGLVGVLALIASSGVIGMPGTEPTMLFAGFNVYQHHLSLLGIIVFGALADLIGAAVAYAIGSYGSRELLERRSGRLRIDPRSLDRAHRWFERHGARAILVSRLLPFVRAAFPYAAGAARMPFGRFVTFAAVGSFLWIGVLGVLGRAIGQSWDSWRHHLEYADYVVAVIIVLALVVGLLKRRRAQIAAHALTLAAAHPDAASSVDVGPR